MTLYAALSVDLDEIPCYAAIHGIESQGLSAVHAVYDKAIPRYEELLDKEGIRATFFTIGSDLSREENAATIARLCAAGHEIANHSYSHFYDLTRRDRDVIRNDIAMGAREIERVTKKKPVGFRAPGYTITDTVFEVLEELGVEYDSSVFPCPSYFAAKSAAIAAISFRGRKSRSIVDDPRVLFAPADPYRVGKPYWKKGRGLLELPIGVTRDATARLPYIGTSVVLWGEPAAKQLTRAIIGRPFVNLELHGIDLSDAEQDNLDFLRPHQPDLRKTFVQKSSALRAAIHQLRDAGYEFVTCAEAAAKLH
ncbi:MAG: polysaccharide deacetylase family protein [Sandaracinaceae bacterium]|nr:polysaccharide deacetylase family protein [Sandaracinaceae bacterium]